MGDLIEKVQGSKLFTIIDLNDGSSPIEIAEEDKENTAFKFDNLLYEWSRMPKGFENGAFFRKLWTIYYLFLVAMV